MNNLKSCRHNWKWNHSRLYWYCNNCPVISSAHRPNEIDKLYMEIERLQRMIVALSNAFMGPAENWGEVVYALIYEGNQIAKLKEEK